MTPVPRRDEAEVSPTPVMEALLSDFERAHDPRRLSSCGTVAFAVRPIDTARLAWLNDRWFLEHGVNTLDREIRTGVVGELLAGYAVRSECDSAGGTRSFEADLYGGTNGADHGGSGRCGMFGGYNAKGIGKTPLVSESVDERHKTGWLSLAEALREAVTSEVCRSELPYGAIPILAIIDTGFTYRPAPGAAEERCAIVLRPNFIRPAHFERSIYFGDSGTPASHQYRDARRVAEATQTLGRSGDLYLHVGETFTRFAKQLGAARAYRLWQGRFLTSNLSIDGAYVDFGSFRSVPSWRKRVGLAGESFGSEVKQLRAGFASVMYYYAKYSGGNDLPFEVASFYRQLSEIENRAFLDSCLRGLGVGPRVCSDRPRLEGLISAYYDQEQRIVESDGPECNASTVFILLSGMDCKVRSQSEIGVASDLIAELDRLEGAGLPVSRTRTAGFFAPRNALNYATLNAEIGEFVRRLEGSKDVEVAVTDFIEARLSESLRNWRNLAPELEVLQSATDVTSAVLVCRDLAKKQIVLHLEGPLLDNMILVLGRFIPIGSSGARGEGELPGRARFRKVVSDMGQVVPTLRALGVDAGDRLKPFGISGVEGRLS